MEAPEGTLYAFRALLLIRCLRSDRLVSSVEGFVRRVFQQENFLTQASTTELQLGELVDKEVASATPVALCSVPGHDASNRVEQLAAERTARCVAVALGSAEGFTLADAAITSAAKTGTWVLLKNVHLAPQWLGQLEKRLHALRPHASFRLFLTMETHPKVPVNLLRRARVLMFEPAPGVRAHLQQLLRGIPTARVAKAPAERARLYFLLAWLHAVVVERLRYVPLGWSKGYEFGEADHESALATIDRWLDSSAIGEEEGAAKTHISPEKIPWAAIRTLLTESVYGGRIDNEYDQRVLESFVGTLFTPKSYDYNFALVKREEGSSGSGEVDESPEEEEGASKRKISASIHKDLCIPDATRMEQFLTWVDALPDREPPTWLGLPADAERVILTARGQTLLSRARKMQSVASDESGEADGGGDAVELSGGLGGMGGADGGEGGSTAANQQQQPAWMRTLGTHVAQWLDLLPNVSTPPQVPSDLLKDPLVRVFVREAQLGRSLLARVVGDLQEVAEVCAGTAPQTNHRRMLLSSLSRGLIPDHWRKFKVPRNRSLAQWIVNLGTRLKQATDAEAKSLAGAGGASLGEGAVWLGGLFNPGAFITATRQAVAQRHAWSLEELTLRLDLSSGEEDEGAEGGGMKHEEDRFAVSGLRLEGARWEGGKDGRLALCAPGDGGFTRLGQCGIRWVKGDSEADASSESKGAVTLLPVYLNGDREDLLFGVDISIRDEDKAAVLQRGLAITTD
ncbi:dynein heavy chain domain-containing protein [Piptocephalis cylindrospora]|uniref:Dynein heavy chain domain-containing protein n=1 Tax=Piptocephalis cylindrospora TaxID=1907219 RepID=A0A4P9Y1F2_9FUNG|nr:dynein heavy chain domain-containing protein [Piptocephalis cylindrospora]|eukprot:RKP12605.1 dynein heavy chain domain-containing protein [Piptocephalis cylindrospora]